MKPFEPKGDMAQWRMVLPLLERLDIGEVLTYEAVFDVLDIEPTKRNRERIRQPVTLAANCWGKERQRALMAVWNVGWKVCTPAEQEGKARKQHRRGRRQIVGSRTTIRNLDRSLLAPADRDRIDRMENELSRQSDMIKRIDTRQAKIERVVAEDRAARLATDDKVARLEEALRRHGIEPD